VNNNVKGRWFFKKETSKTPFGMTMPGRSYNAHTLRHGFTGHEKESDLAEGFYTTEYRLYDARVGRWLSVDPLFEKYVSMSPYNYCAGNPVMMVDPDGRELKDIFKGAIAAINDNIMLGVGDYRGRMGRQAVDASDYNLGLIIGDGLSMLIGSGEMMSGTGMMAQGSAVVAVSVSGGVTAPVAVAGAGEVVAGAALAEHGYFMAAQGASNLANKKGHLPESKKQIESDRRNAVNAAWKGEKNLVEKTGRGTRLWNKSEKKELL
jgi:RHS repeat-associated protein